MLICEEIFLLLTTDEGSSEPWVSSQKFALSAALLMDLAMAEKIVFSGDEKNPHVTLVPDAPGPTSTPSNPVLDFGLNALRTHGRFRSATVIGASWFAPRTTIAHHLADSQIVSIKAPQLLGIVPERYPTADPGPEANIRIRLTAVLSGDRVPTSHDAVALALLLRIGAANRILLEERGSLDSAGLLSRISAITESTVGSNVSLKPLQHAIDSLQAVITGAAAGSLG